MTGIHSILQSMRLRLLLVSLAIFLIAALITGVLISRQSLHELDEILNANLAQTARSMFSVLKGELERDNDDKHLQQIIDRYSALASGDENPSRAEREFGIDAEERAEQLEYQQQIYLKFVHDDQPAIISSRVASLELPNNQTNGYFELQQGGHNWHFYAVSSDDLKVRLYLGQRTDYRQEMIEESTESILEPLLIVLPVLAVLLWWGLGRGLTPLQTLSADIGRRTGEWLDPVDDKNISTETRSLVNSLNELLLRLKKSLNNERRRVAMEVARGARSDSERQQALSQIDRASANMTNLVDDLLALARLDADSSNFEWTEFDLRRLWAEAIANAALPALDRDIDISLQPDQPHPTHSSLRLHELVISNLLLNAIKYTPEGGEIAVRLLVDDQQTGYEVVDNGPGISEDELANITERFYRGINTAGKSAGAGLGLSIVQRACDLLGARLVLENRSTGGLRAAVHWQRPQPD